jgi:hypothetical protein
MFKSILCNLNIELLSFYLIQLELEIIQKHNMIFEISIYKYILFNVVLLKVILGKIN